VRQAIVLAVLFLATLTLALWALGVFGPSPEPDPSPTPPTERGSDRPTSTNGTDLATTEPTDEPPVDPVLLPSRVRVLVLGNAPRSFVQWLYQMWEGNDRVAFQSWTPNPTTGMKPAHSPSVLALEEPPTGESLGEYEVLILDDIDPKAMPDAFWQRVGERVRSGALGLLIHPGIEHGMALASQPSLRAVLPIEPKPPVGIPPGQLVAGVFPTERPFAITSEGQQHPLTRLVRWPGWTAKKWQALASGPKPWGTKFAHPTGEPSPKAVTLLTVKGHRGDAMPALVASDPANGRVLWMGFHDVGDGAYRDGLRSEQVVRNLSLAWLAWLAGITA
jgi:hypothetical protein